MSCYEKLFEKKIYSDQRKLWEVINGLTSRNKYYHRTDDLAFNGETFSGESLANVMNEHFVNATSHVATDGNLENDARTADKSIVPYSISFGNDRSV